MRAGRSRRKQRSSTRPAEARRRQRQRAGIRSPEMAALRANDLVAELFDEKLHKKRQESLRNALTGTLHAGRISIAAIGRALAEHTGRATKHAVKQVDRFVGNEEIDDAELQRAWARHVVGDRKNVLVILDWTDFDHDGQTVVALSMATGHGRATPLMWKTVKKSSLKNRRFSYESEVVERLHDALPEDVEVTLLADRGFGDVERYAHLELHGWDYVIRFRGVVKIETAKGERGKAKDFLLPTGRARILRDVLVTGAKEPVPAVVTVKGKKMKDAWYLATSLKDLGAAKIVALYGKRFSIEETFRDAKNLNFGAGLSDTRVTTPQRRDRLLLLQAMAHTLLSLLGAAGESLGWDRRLKVNTAKTRQHSLYNQGLSWFRALPFLDPGEADTLLDTYANVLLDDHFVTLLYAQI